MSEGDALELLAGADKESSPHASSTPRRRKSGKFIKSTVAVHDRTQLETVFDYYLPRDAKGSKESNLCYQVDAFLFYPRQFGLDPVTYPKERFYNDIRPLVRFREPRLSFKQILGRKPTQRSPLVALQQFVKGLAAGRESEPMDVMVQEARVFACSIVSNLLRGIDRRRKRFVKIAAAMGCEKPVCPPGTKPVSGPAAVERNLKACIKLLNKFCEALDVWRALIAEAMTIDDARAKALVAEMRLIDEYLYYRLSDALAQLVRMVGACPEEAPSEALALFHDTVRRRIAHDEAHARQWGYIRIDATSDIAMREQYMHRRGELKRRIWGALHLSIRTTPLFKFQQQLGAMVAAGLAAIWAAWAQIMIVRRYIVEDGEMSGVWGMSGIVFMTAAVLAYVVKDRIKEFGRSYFRGRLFRRLPDQSERIYYADRVVGSIRETARFLLLKSLPSAIAQVRARIMGDEGHDDEVVDAALHYSKEVRLSGDLRILDRYPLRAVHDILRLNIDTCLPRLGEPMRAIDIVDAEGEAHSLEFPKVYYLDLALAYSKVARGGEKRRKAIEYFRLVMDKSGLKRIERLL